MSAPIRTGQLTRQIVASCRMRETESWEGVAFERSGSKRRETGSSTGYGAGSRCWAYSHTAQTVSTYQTGVQQKGGANAQAAIKNDNLGSEKMKTPSLESLACAKRANVATWRQLAAVVALVTSLSACEKNPSGPAEAGQVSFNVRFLTAPLALSTIVATLSSSGLPTVTITLTPVTGTDNLEWTGGSTTVTPGTYSIDIQGKDASGTLTYRGNGSIGVSAGRSSTFVFALVCVSTACEQANGTVMLTVLTPQLEVEPNNTLGTANLLTVFSIFGGQLEDALANGVISPSDLDFYSFPATNLASGDSIFVVLLAKDFGSTLDGVIGLFDAFGNLLVGKGNGSGDPVIAFPVPSSSPSTATYEVAVAGLDPGSGTRSTGRYTVLVYHCKPGGANNVVCR